ncbi:hypothetical protein IV203_022565 [Nitzschia inconspicua]|uniref:Uncharacterized protein n=1 Tax=Nitzschia inconspicua TaxID=303405 RepID=A0A9K3KJ36_9STRA|nr:hypothetical protein IV203_022565 [Nitzschia inconspicua]
MTLTSSTRTKAIIRTVLVVFIVLLVTPTAFAEETYSCPSLCTNEGDVVTNPDQTVTYDWNSRVPVPSSTIAETVQTFTCAEFDVRLTTFDQNDCAKHQQGLQAAGCNCGGGSGAASTGVATALLTVSCFLLTSLAV